MAAYNPLASVANYSDFLAELFNRPGVVRSTITVWSASPYTGIAEGELFFEDGFRLRMREELDFDAELITSYGYEKRPSAVGERMPLSHCIGEAAIWNRKFTN